MAGRRGGDGADFAHVGNEPVPFRSIYLAIHGAEGKLPKRRGLASLVSFHNPLVSLGACDEGCVVGLSVGHEVEERFFCSAKDLLFHEKLYRIRAAGKVHKPDGVKIRLPGDEDRGLEYVFTVFPVLVVYQLVDGNFLKPVTQENLWDVSHTPGFGKHVS